MHMCQDVAFHGNSSSSALCLSLPTCGAVPGSLGDVKAAGDAVPCPQPLTSLMERKMNPGDLGGECENTGKQIWL